jgi:hypothetical protein
MRFLLLMTAGCLWTVTSASAQSISAADASKHVGEHATVCGQIAGEHTASTSRGTPTFINLDKPYPNQIFTILIWGEDRSAVGQLPASGRVCATGTIREYRGAPEIVVRDARSWSVPK